MPPLTLGLPCLSQAPSNLCRAGRAGDHIVPSRPSPWATTLGSVYSGRRPMNQLGRQEHKVSQAVGLGHPPAAQRPQHLPDQLKARAGQQALMSWVSGPASPQPTTNLSSAFPSPPSVLGDEATIYVQLLGGAEYSSR